MSNWIKILERNDKLFMLSIKRKFDHKIVVQLTISGFYFLWGMNWLQWQESYYGLSLNA